MPEWEKITHGIVRRFEVAAAVGGSACWNAKGSKACAAIIKKMARIIDEEIENRKTKEPTK